MNQKRCDHKKEIDMLAPNWKMESLFSRMVMSLYIMWIRIKCPLKQEEKTIDGCAGGGGTHFQNSKVSIKTGVYFNHFFKHFAREAGSSL